MERFRRLRDALERADAAGGLPTWAEDLPSGGGKKRYCFGGHEEFREATKGAPARERHFYEVLRPDAPTHLYLDVEWAAEGNEGVSEEATLEAIDREVRSGFAALLPGAGEVRRVLTSASGPRKRSWHALYKARRAAFAGPYHCGAFLRRLRFPLVAGPSGAKTEAVDRAVYTRNRLWRCAGSTKLSDPTRPLLPRPPGRGTRFLDTLAQRVRRGASLLECRERDGSEPRSGLGPRPEAPPPPRPASDAEGALASALGREIEAFWGDGVVRLASYDRASRTAFYSSDSLWCGLKGASHGSNHVYFVADLRRGAWRQGCHNRTRDTCCERGEPPRPRWNAWREFADADGVRRFVERSAALAGEYLDAVRAIEARFAP